MDPDAITFAAIESEPDRLVRDRLIDRFGEERYAAQSLRERPGLRFVRYTPLPFAPGGARFRCSASSAASQGVFSGGWIDQIIGLDDVTVETVMARAPDGTDMFEVVRFRSPSAGAHEPAPAANRPGLRHVVRGPEGLIVELAERLDGARS